MKTIYKSLRNISLALCATMAISSWDSFLDTKPYDFVAPQTFYTNESECTMALAGVYYTLVYEQTYGNYYSCMISNVDDLSYYQRPEGQTASYVYGNDHSPSEQYIWGAWETLYKGINNANMLIENVDGADMEDAIKTRIKGEAKFLRAYYHFLLVQGWYEVPLRPESFKDVNNSSKEATSHVEALDWIIQEMEDCVDMVDNTNYDLSPSYVKKNSVMGVLARVYLWRACYPFDGKISSDGKAYFEKAAYWATQVKNSNKHHLNPDVYTMWKAMASDTYDTEYNESIWEAEFIGTRDDGSYTAGRIGNVIGNIQKGTANPGNGYAYGFYAPTLILWDLFDATEEIFCTIQNEEESIMISKWPEYSEDRAFPAEEKAIETIKEAVRGIRNIRTEMNVAPSRKASVYVVSENDEIRKIFEEGKLFFASLAYANEIMIQADKTGIADDAVSVVIPGATLYIPFAELVDITQEIERLKKEQKRLEGELARSKGMLSNERFLSKAPEAKIAEEKEKLAKYEQMMEQVTKRLEQLA